MRFDLLTLHPGMCMDPLNQSILGRAQQAGVVTIKVHDLRQWTEDKHRTADDTPYGGGAGMVMVVEDATLECVLWTGTRTCFWPGGNGRGPSYVARSR